MAPWSGIRGGTSQDRLKWTLSHPWLWGSYLGLGAFLAVVVFLPVFMHPRASLMADLSIGAVAGASIGLLTAITIKRRWGFAPDAENRPAPTLHRPWSTMSNRLLKVFFWASLAAAIGSAVQVIIGPARLSATLTTGLSILCAATLWAERKRRRIQG